MSEWSSQPPEVRVEIDRIMSAMETRHAEIAELTMKDISAQIETYSPPASSGLVQDAYEHTYSRILDFVHAAKENRTPTEAELALSRAAVVRRAQQGVPLESILHAVRVGQRTMWPLIVEEAGSGGVAREAALALAGNAMDYLDVVSSDIAEVYVRAIQDAMVGVESEERDVIETLLSGRFVLDAPGRDRLDRFNLRPPEHFHLILVRFDRPDGDEIESLLGMVRTATKLRLADGPKTALIVVRQGEIVGIVTGATTVRTMTVLHEVSDMFAADRRPGLRAGVSGVLAELADVPSAYGEAEAALLHASAARPVLEVSGIPLLEFLCTTANPLSLKLIPPGVDALATDNRASASRLVSTVLALADASGSIKVAAASLQVHPNTVRNRLERVKLATGLDPMTFYGLRDLVVGFRLLGARGPRPREDLHAP